MAELFSGIIAGYAMALVFTALSAHLIVNTHGQVALLTKTVFPNISSMMLAVPISIFSFIIWTLIGILLGFLYRGIADKWISMGGLGSPNWPFTISVCLFSLLALLFIAYIWRVLHWQVIVMIIAFAALFGWALPHMVSVQ